MLIFYREQNNLNYPAFVEKKNYNKRKSSNYVLSSKKNNNFFRELSLTFEEESKARRKIVALKVYNKLFIYIVMNGT